MLVIASGYFDPIHVGHIHYLKLAAEYGKLIVIVNNDYQAILKKSKSFMNENDRVRIVKSVKYVSWAVLSIDADETVCHTILNIASKFSGQKIIFAKGGDRYSNEIPEYDVCNNLGIKIVDGLGKKIRSSSELVHKALSK